MQARLDHSPPVPDLARGKGLGPGKLSYASSGTGSSGHLISETFKMTAGIDMLHVPFKGGSQSITSVMANDVQPIFDTMFGSRALEDRDRDREDRGRVIFAVA